ncbi:MAG TPA: S1/P1 nuclease [Gammaproteobacteria bacterium]|nr:S1/P1 nuclease [Gammaproteobacteria bacterium]
MRLRKRFRIRFRESLRARPLVALLGCAAALAPPGAGAYGPQGHRVAGALAEPLLCRSAAARVAEISGGRSLAELGVWADTIRDEPRWRNTGPWHYMNIADGRALSSYRHPPEGDVLLAIERSAADLTQASSRAERLDALRFLIHFIVDVHQPLHVGRASDRGGNTIDVRYGSTTVNLHRFWDTDVLEVAGLSRAEYERAVRPKVVELARMPQSFAPEAWAAESLALRSQVYAFPRSRGGPAVLDSRYLERADAITRDRLAHAAVRLASTLNRLFGCG